MKVNESTSLGALSSLRATEPVGAGATKLSEPKDRVSVDSSSDVRRTVDAVQRAAGSQRAARLAHIEQLVRSGSYKPDPAQVAAQILEDAEVDAHLSAMLGH